MGKPLHESFTWMIEHTVSVHQQYYIPPPLTLQLSQQERRETHMSLSGGLRDRGGYRGVGTDERSDALGEGVDNRDEIDVD